jgi:hypothetical protein
VRCLKGNHAWWLKVGTEMAHSHLIVVDPLRATSFTVSRSACVAFQRNVEPVVSLDTIFSVSSLATWLLVQTFAAASSGT